jgi:hypothetical protein
MAIYVRCIDNTLAADVLVVGEIYGGMLLAIPSAMRPTFSMIAATATSWGRRTPTVISERHRLR